MKLRVTTTCKPFGCELRFLHPNRPFNVLDFSFMLIRVRLYWDLNEKDKKLREQFRRNWYRLNDKGFKISPEDVDFVIWMGLRFGESELIRLWRYDIIDGELMVDAAEVVIFDKSFYKRYCEFKERSREFFGIGVKYE